MNIKDIFIAKTNNLKNYDKHKLLNFDFNPDYTNISNSESTSLSNNNKSAINSLLSELKSNLNKNLTTKTKELNDNLNFIKSNFNARTEYINNEHKYITTKIDNLKYKENRISELITSILIKSKNNKNIKKIFNILYNYSKLKLNLRLRKNKAIVNYNNNKLQKIFRYWKYLNQSEKVKNNINKLANVKLSENKIIFEENIKNFKDMITEIDKKILIIRQTRQNISYNYSQNMIKTISDLNNKLNTIKLDEIKSINNKEKNINDKLNNIVNERSLSYNYDNIFN